MAKNKKRQYHKPPASKATSNRPFRLSQCMIVKNEEKNIVKALSWAKGYAYEQIVVDTGSTDRTVEIAEGMGAKVYHFKWINDFSAAKNYAIEQCSGDWIAFLDADEYFTDEDTKKLMQVIQMIENNPEIRKIKTALHCPITNLDDDGKPFTVLIQQRVFRNVPEIRYSGRIHEGLKLPEPSISAPDITIIHTGYSQAAYNETGKAVRNVEMIEAELKERPNDPNLKCYLADSLRIEGPSMDLDRAEALYREAIYAGLPMVGLVEQSAYYYLVSKYFEDEKQADEIFELSRKAYEKFPENPDFIFYYGRKLQNKGDFEGAWAKYIETEKQLKGTDIGRAAYLLKHSISLYYSMVIVAEKQGNINEVIRCATLLLNEDKCQPAILTPYIQAFNREGYKTSAEELFVLLGRLYDFNDVKDKVLIMKAANTAGNLELVSKVLTTFTSDELGWLTGAQE